MEITVNFLDNLRLEAKFDDFTVVADQPIRYKGDGSAPSPFDYFLASSALCAAYFIRVYCLARDLPTDDIRVSQNNIVDPENRYNQIFQIDVALPDTLSEKDRQGILRAVDRCTVKKVVQAAPDFRIEATDPHAADAQALLVSQDDDGTRTRIPGKDAALEDTIARLTDTLAALGMKIEVSSWRNILPNVWSLNIRDAASPMCFTNGKGATRNSALCSALGEFIERLSCNFFYNDQYFGPELAGAEFVHYPEERWFPLEADDALPEGILDAHCRAVFDPDGELRGSHLVDTNSGRADRGICCIPYRRRSDGETVYVPSNLIENLFLSNGMSAGNTLAEAQVQGLSEIFERAVKREIIENELALPDVPEAVLTRYPDVLAGIAALEAQGFPVLVKDASLGGRFPVMCVTLLNPRTGGVFASFGAHPQFGVALERSLTELLQGRSFEGLNDVPRPTFNSQAVREPENFVEHFIDSTGVVSWRFFSATADHPFCEWNFAGSTEDECTQLFEVLDGLGKDAYVAVFDHLGVPACRILVPGYSEVYPVEDLIWDNTNKAIAFREPILGLHRLDDDDLRDLVASLEDSELDGYSDIRTLIGVEFDENTVWGQLTIFELGLLIHLALGDADAAIESLEALLQYNDNTIDRNRFFHALHAVLTVTLDAELALDDYRDNFSRLYGEQTVAAAVGSVSGEVRFYGLSETDMALAGLDRHLRLLESYRKLHGFRRTRATTR
ncbi:MAG: OsmC domain/YcaO domain-containing protein [Pseudomonadota bacterium]